MKIVAVTSCITGIAHTYMAAEALEQAAIKAGHEMTVETQGSAGSTPMAQSTIDAADFVIFACDLEIKNLSRFNGKPFVSASVSQALADADSVIDSAVLAAQGKTLVVVEQGKAPSNGVWTKATEATALDGEKKPGFFKKLFG